MSDEPLTLAVLANFHREVWAPEFARIFDLHLEMNTRFDEVFGHFAAMHKRFDRLDQIRAIYKRVDA